MDEWTKTSERLPPSDMQVLAYNPKKIQSIAIAAWIDRNDFDAGKFWIYNGSSGGSSQMIKDNIPTHWMLLPEVPQS